jgi:hypothetical protein
MRRTENIRINTLDERRTGLSRRRSRTRRARRCPRRISLARIFNLARSALSIEKIRYLPTASIRVSRRLNKNCTRKFVELRLTRPVGSSEQLRDGQNPHRLELLHRGDCAVPAKACARNSLTPGQPVRLSQTGLEFGAMSILNSKNGQHLRSKEIESARSPRDVRSVAI